MTRRIVKPPYQEILGPIPGKEDPSAPTVLDGTIGRLVHLT
jgi:hypothetical protein